MKKKIITCLLAVSCMSAVVFADSTIDHVSNYSMEIPDGYSLINEDIKDDLTIKTYMNKDNASILAIAESPYSPDLAEFSSLLLDGMLTGIKQDTNYKEIQPTENIKLECGEVGHFTAFTNDNYSTINIIFAFDTGDSTVNFVYKYDFSSSDCLNSFQEILDSIQPFDGNIELMEVQTESSEGQSQETEVKKEITKYPKGKYKVGQDIPAGEYTLFSDSDKGYFCVSSDSNGDDIIFNDNFKYDSIVTVNDGEYLELSRCYAVPYGEKEIDVEHGDMFKVGTDIPSGEYKVDSGSDRGYYCIYPDSRQRNIVSNDLFEGQSYFTVSDGQYLVLSKCKIVSMPEASEQSPEIDPKEVQRKLNENGYDCGTPDGIIGKGSAAAIEKYQSDNGLEVTGTITEELIQSLGL